MTRAACERSVSTSVLALILLTAILGGCRESSDLDTGIPDVPPLPVDGGDGPGDLLSATGLVSSPDHDVWSVRYRSTGVDGDPVEVTGVVARPSSEPPPGGFPIVSFAHGTTGIGDRCAPSARGADAVAGLEAFLDAGWVVVATDYEGLGTPGVHPYLVSVSEGRSVLDIARAAGDLLPDVSSQVVLAGHSQGGHAALAAAANADAWAEDLDVLGTIAIAPAADVSAVLADGLQHPALAGIAVLIGGAWPEIYPELDPEVLLGPGSSGLVSDAKDDDVCTADVSRRAADEVERTDLRDGALSEWLTRAEENSIAPRTVAGPLLVVHGADDQVIPAERSRTLVDDRCAVDADTQYSEYEADHVAVFAMAERAMVQWAADRLDGRAVDGSCPP